MESYDAKNSLRISAPVYGPGCDPYRPRVPMSCEMDPVYQELLNHPVVTRPGVLQKKKDKALEDKAK